MRVFVKLDGLISGIVAGHVAFSTVNTHFLKRESVMSRKLVNLCEQKFRFQPYVVNKGDNLLLVVQIAVGPDPWKSEAYLVLNSWNRARRAVHLPWLQSLLYLLDRNGFFLLCNETLAFMEVFSEGWEMLQYYKEMAN